MYILRKYAHIYSYLTVYKNIYNIISVAVVMPSGRQNGYTAQVRSPVLAAESITAAQYRTVTLTPRVNALFSPIQTTVTEELTVIILEGLSLKWLIGIYTRDGI